MSLDGLIFSLADVHCEHCQKKFKLSDIKDNEVLVCEECGHSQPITMRGESPHIEFERSLIRPADTVSIERSGSILIIEKKWSSRKAKILWAIAAVWVLAYIGLFVAVSSNPALADQLAFYLYPKIAGALIGVCFIFWALRNTLNRTRIMIKNKKMAVTTTPLAWGSIRVFKIKEIESFTHWKSHRKKGHPVFNFRIEMNMKDGRKVVLCPAQNANEAAYIEKTLEEFMTIEQTVVVVDPLVS